jgi:nitroreductase
MDVFKAINSRKSIRAFKSTPLKKEQINRILEAARLAPSAHNYQPWKFVLVKEDGLKKKLARACLNQTFIAEAPIVIVGTVDLLASEYALVDGAIALEHIVLQAEELGLGTCWIGAFDESKVKELLLIPKNYKVVGIIPVGEKNEKPFPSPRKELKEIVFENYFNKKS